MGQISFDRPADPLYAQLPLRHVAVLPVLGIPVRFESNSAVVIDVVHASFGAWRALEPDGTAPANRVRIVVHDAGDGTGQTAITYRRPEPGRMMFFAAESLGTADVARRDALAYVTPTLVAAGAHFRYGVVEALTLFLVTGADRFPVHASALLTGDTAILLCGPSGAGKSTLAYAAATVFGDAGRMAVQHLAADGGWRIAAPAGPHEAVEQIRRIVASTGPARTER
jgi:hypothetical protein